MKPLSASSSFSPPKNASSAPTGLPVRGSRMPVAGGATTLIATSVPFECPLLPLVDKADGQHRKEHHHRPEAEGAELAVYDRPGEQERDLEVEDDEQDRDQI